MSLSGRGWLGVGLFGAMAVPTAAACADPSSSIEYAGCKEVWLEDEPREVPRCVFDPNEPLRVWVHALDPAEVSVYVNDKPWPAEDLHLEEFDGFGLRVELPPDAELLELDGLEGVPLMLPLVSTERAGAGPAAGVSTSIAVDDKIADAFDAAAAGDYGEALRILDQVKLRAQRYPKGRADHATYLGMVLWWQGHYHDAAMSLREGVAFATKFDDAELLRDALPMYAAVLAELGYLEAASEWADRALILAREDPALFPCVEYGKLLSTLAWVDVSRSLIQGAPLAHAQALLEQALRHVGPRGECPDPQSVPAIELSLALGELHTGDPAAALVRLAEVSLDDATLDQRLRLVDVEVAALTALGTAPSVVEASLERLAAVVGDAATHEGRWRLALRRGDLRMREGQIDEAVVAYREAEVQALELTKLAAVGVGRETTAILHTESTESLVAALVAQGRPEDAFCAAREAQARRTHAVDAGGDDPAGRRALFEKIAEHASLRQQLAQHGTRASKASREEQRRIKPEIDRIEADIAELADALLRDRSTWDPKCEQLPARAEGELLLGLHAMRRGWYVFAQDDRGTIVRWIAGGPSHALDDPALGEELLEPLTDRLTTARVVKVVAGGLTQAVDVHLLQWQGARLVEHLPVVYGAELPRRDAHDVAPSERRALVVANPTEDLRMAGPEGMIVELGLELHGWEVDALTPAEATYTNVLEHLKTASFFYYAGHAEHDVGMTEWGLLPPYAGGTPAWPARMSLQEPVTLDIQDIVMLEPAPRYVALMGCQTGVPPFTGGGMSLALAFLVAGAEEVVATPEKTADAVALATGARLLKGLSHDGLSLAAGLQRAQAELLHSGQEVGRYRVWVR